MTDSIIQFTRIEHIQATQADIDSLPFIRTQEVNQNDLILSSYPKSEWIDSKLTGAKYKITPVFRYSGFSGKEDLIGYTISINIPACVIGNNALLEILVYACCVFALEFLKSYLLEAGCSRAIVSQLDLEHSSIKGLALTYLLECEDSKEAKANIKKIEMYGDATLNTKRTNPKQKKPITTWSSAGQTTVIVWKPRGFDAKAYVKSGPTPRSYERFDSDRVRAAVYAESRRKVRLEFDAGEKWLLDNNAESPLVWKNRARASELIAKAFQEIKEYLRVSENLRSKRPKPDQISAKLSPAEQTILLDYFDGVDPKNHPSMIGKSAQYFSSVKRHIEVELRIDITIPWLIHSKKISPDLPDWMQLPDTYEAPSALVEHCFVRKTAKAKLKQLHQINSQLASTQMPIVSKQKVSASAAKQRLPGKGLSCPGSDDDISDLFDPT